MGKVPLRISNRPDQALLGSFGFGGFTGILPAALGANSEIFQFRWTDPTRLAIIRRVTLAAAVSTTFFAAGVPVQIDMVKATGWTGQGTGGTGITPASLLKRRTSLAASLVRSGDLRIATTAALGAGTKTLETVSQAALAAAGPSAAPGLIVPPGTQLFNVDAGAGDHPLVLAANEGFVLRSVAVPATGTWTASVQVEWDEYNNF